MLIAVIPTLLSAIIPTFKKIPSLCKATSAPPIPENNDKTLIPLLYKGRRKATVLTRKLFPRTRTLSRVENITLVWPRSNPKHNSNSSGVSGRNS